MSVRRSFGDATDDRNYRLVALPGDRSTPVASTLGGAAGEDWRVFYDNGQSGAQSDYLVEHDGSARFQFAPGRGFWMLSETAWQSSGETETVALDEDGTYAINLHDGWNIISNPFGTDVNWSTVQQANDASQTLWSWNGGYDEATTFASAMDGEAYYFFNEQGLSELRLPYSGSGSANRTTAQARAAEGEAPPPLTLTATAEGDTLSSQVEVGLALSAKDGFDALDQYAPPGAFASVDLHLEADFEAASGHDRLFAEYRPAGQGQTFDLMVQSKAGHDVTLRASGPEAFAGQEVALVNRTTARRYDLRRQRSVPVRLAANQEEARFALLVGSAAFVEQEAGAIVPEASELLGSYPNPFRSRTTIAYTVAEESMVRLEVYDVLGRRVRVLVDEPQTAGRKEVTLSGQGLASGVYLYRLHIGDRQDTGRVVLVR